MNREIIDRWSFIFATALFIMSFVIVYKTTSEFFGSLTAAILTAALGWGAFVIVRLTILAFKK